MFGGLNLILIGDLLQISPVTDRPIYSKWTSSNSLITQGQSLFENILAKGNIIILDQVERLDV